MKKLPLLLATAFLVFSLNSCNWFSEQVDELKDIAETEDSADDDYDYSDDDYDYDEEDVEDSPIQTKGDYSRMFVELVMPEEGGIFRGAKFDDWYEDVYDMEDGYSTSEVYEENDDELIITTDMGEEILDFADVTYYFDESGLYEIYADIYSNSEVREERVYNDLVKHYEDAFGVEGELAEDGFIEFVNTDPESEYEYMVAFQRLDYDSGLEMYISLL